VFRGVNNINLDAKGRMAVPTRYREVLARHCNGHVVVTISPTERCLWLYPLPDWDDVERKIVALPTLDARAQRLKRMLIGHATDCDMDGSGRILLSGPLREFSGLEKKVVLIGQGNKFEVWDEESWTVRRDGWLSDDVEEAPLSSDLETLSL
jgi:MraZ protein